VKKKANRPFDTYPYATASSIKFFVELSFDKPNTPSTIIPYYLN